jgi:hypothetical protein
MDFSNCLLTLLDMLLFVEYELILKYPKKTVSILQNLEPSLLTHEKKRTIRKMVLLNKIEFFERTKVYSNSNPI